MKCEELRDDYAAYALGIADEPERSEIGAHISRECPVCLPAVRRELSTVAAFSSTVKLTDPPARLRRRIVAMIAPEQSTSRWSVWLPWSVAAAFALLLALIAVPARRAHQDTAQLQRALSILNDPVARDVSFGAPAARGRVFVSPNKGVMLIAANLPTLEAGKTFELWVIPKGANPVPAGTFNALPDASAVYIHDGPVQNAAAVAVTVEPAGGSPRPTTTPFIVAKL